MARFVATGDEDGPIIARSPVFRLYGGARYPGPRPPDALRELVEELTAAGWRKTGAGRAPWDLQFERQREAAVTRRASPPRA